MGHLKANLFQIITIRHDELAQYPQGGYACTIGRNTVAKFLLSMFGYGWRSDSATVAQLPNHKMSKIDKRETIIDFP